MWRKNCTLHSFSTDFEAPDQLKEKTATGHWRDKEGRKYHEGHLAALQGHATQESGNLLLLADIQLQTQKHEKESSFLGSLSKTKDSLHEKFDHHVL